MTADKPYRSTLPAYLSRNVIDFCMVVMSYVYDACGTRVAGHYSRIFDAYPF